MAVLWGVSVGVVLWGCRYSAGGGGAAGGYAVHYCTSTTSTPQPAAQHVLDVFSACCGDFGGAVLLVAAQSTSVAERFASTKKHVNGTQPTVNRFGKRSDPYHPAQIKEVHSNKIGKTFDPPP